jgi:hypothetical protein
MNPAAAERERKASKPDDYCASRGCLWNVSRSGPCRRHDPMAMLASRARLSAITGYTMGDAPEPTLRTRLAQQPVDLPSEARPW